MAVMRSSLPMSYETLINVIGSYPKDQITVDFVKNKLRDKWRRRQKCYDFQSGPCWDIQYPAVVPMTQPDVIVNSRGVSVPLIELMYKCSALVTS